MNAENSISAEFQTLLLPMIETLTLKNFLSKNSCIYELVVHKVMPLVPGLPYTVKSTDVKVIFIGRGTEFLFCPTPWFLSANLSNEVRTVFC